MLRRLFIIATTICLAGCGEETGPLPPLAAGLPTSIDVAELQFDARIKRQFAIGTSEQQLVEELRSQGFDIKSSSGQADYTRPDGWFCQTVWSVRWRATTGKLTDASGLHFQRCV